MANALQFMKTIVIDENAHAILMRAKKGCEESGIEKPSHSDAIRWMENKAKEEK